MTSDATLASELAYGAGQVLLGLRRREEPFTGADADAAANDYLLDGLARHRPDDAVLSEESEDSPARLSADRVWIIDPLDGTREYTKRDANGWRPDFAVHVALWQRDRGLVAGAVALPARDKVFSTDPAESVPAPSEGPLRLAVSSSRAPALVDTIGDLIDLVLVPMGSAGVKAMAVVTGAADAYLHGGGQYEWDSAAPVAVAAAAGLHTSRLDGSPLIYNNSNPWLPDLLVCRGEHASRWLTALAQIEGAR